MIATGKFIEVDKLHILCGEPYTARVVRTVRRRVQGNLPIVISKRRQVLILRYFQNVRNYKDDESKFKSIMSGTALTLTQTAFDLCMDFTKIGVGALN